MRVFYHPIENLQQIFDIIFVRFPKSLCGIEMLLWIFPRNRQYSLRAGPLRAGMDQKTA
jgi:hypothetical protein